MWRFTNISAMEPDEAAPILAKFADTLNLEMSGKFWAPSESIISIDLWQIRH